MSSKSINVQNVINDKITQNVTSARRSGNIVVLQVLFVANNISGDTVISTIQDSFPLAAVSAQGSRNVVVGVNPQNGKVSASVAGAAITGWVYASIPWIV